MAKTYKVGISTSPEGKGPGVKRTRLADGSYADTVRPDSATLSSDLSYVFKANVKKVSGKR